MCQHARKSIANPEFHAKIRINEFFYEFLNFFIYRYRSQVFVQEEKCDYFKKFKWQCVQTSHAPACAKKYCESGVSFQNSNNCIFYHYFCLPFKLNGPPEQQRSRFRLTHQMALQCICRTHSIRSAQLDASLFFPTRK